ncbi:MAG: hypothetical protein D6679_08070 [Candidatus Hydrogenedentota bacterium]|nr:MAG: hypothetical protein D6679_08070 [Candidatus Hydrogenedentota bacterium]
MLNRKRGGEYQFLSWRQGVYFAKTLPGIKRKKTSEGIRIWRKRWGGKTCDRLRLVKKRRKWELAGNY